MIKLSRKSLNSANFGLYVNNLWSAFTLMDSKADIRLLFKDLFTHTEYKMFAKRLEIARRLLRGERYDKIKIELNVTANTIARINNTLSEKGDGLRKAHEKINRIEDKHFARQREIAKNLENPFLAKAKKQQQTLLGVALKAGVKQLDKTLVRKLKQQTAKKSLPF